MNKKVRKKESEGFQTAEKTDVGAYSLFRLTVAFTERIKNTKKGILTLK